MVKYRCKRNNDGQRNEISDKRNFGNEFPSLSPDHRTSILRLFLTLLKKPLKLLQLLQLVKWNSWYWPQQQQSLFSYKLKLTKGLVPMCVTYLHLLYIVWLYSIKYGFSDRPSISCPNIIGEICKWWFTK